MAIQTINLGTLPRGEGGDSNREAFEKINANFQALSAPDETPVVSDHEDLANIQGGAEGEHYHLTAAELGVLQGVPAALEGKQDSFTLGDLLSFVSGVLTIDLSGTQPKLTAGANVTLEGNIISVDLSSVPSGLTAGDNISIIDGVVSADLSGTQPKLTAGDNVNIDGSVISVDFSPLQPKLTAGDNVSLDGNTVSVDLSGTQPKLTAGSNVTLSGNTLSVDLSGLQTTLTAGDNVSITGGVVSFTPPVSSAAGNALTLESDGLLVTLPSGSGIEYDDLENKPDLKPVATSGEYSDLTGTPNLSAVATSGDYEDLSGTPSMPDRLGRQYVLDGDVEITGLVTGDDIHAGANAWFSKPVHATSEISVGKESTIGLDGGVLGSGSRVSAFRASSHAYGKINPGGWIAGMDSNVAVNNNSTVDKVYGVGAYTQVGENTVVNKVLGFEPVLNHVDPSAHIEQYAGFYFPNLQAVPNISNVETMACFASDMPGAHMSIRGNYMRVDEDGTVNEISPSIISQHTSMTQWPLGRVGYSAPESQETPGGLMAVGVIYLARQCRLTDLGIYLSVGMPGQGKLAVYRQSPRGFLGIKLWESAPFSTEGDGNKNTNPNMLLPSGIYLTVFISDVTNGVRVVANSMANSIFGTSGVDSMETIPFYHVGSLPQTLPADMTPHMPAGFTGSTMADFNFKVL